MFFKIAPALRDVMVVLLGTARQPVSVFLTPMFVVMGRSLLPATGSELQVALTELLR